MAQKKHYSGKHVTPRRRLAIPPHEAELQDLVADAEGVSWAVWARRSLIAAAQEYAARECADEIDATPSIIP